MAAGTVAAGAVPSGGSFEVASAESAPSARGWQTFSGPDGRGYSDKQTAIQSTSKFLHDKSQSYPDKAETGAYVVQSDDGRYHALWKKGTPNSVSNFDYSAIRGKGYNPVAGIHTHPTDSYREGPSIPDVFVGAGDWRGQAQHGSTFDNYVVASDGDTYQYAADAQFTKANLDGDDVINTTRVQFRFDVDPTKTVDIAPGLDYIPLDQRIDGPTTPGGQTKIVP